MYKDPPPPRLQVPIYSQVALHLKDLSIRIYFQLGPWLNGNGELAVCWDIWSTQKRAWHIGHLDYEALHVMGMLTSRRGALKTYEHKVDFPNGIRRTMETIFHYVI